MIGNIFKLVLLFFLVRWLMKKGFFTFLNNNFNKFTNNTQRVQTERKNKSRYLKKIFKEAKLNDEI